MNFVPILSKILLSILLATTVLYRYGNWFRHHIIVTIVVLLAWCFSLLIIFILPLDVISTVFRQCLEENIYINSTNNVDVNTSVTLPVTCAEPFSHVPDKVFPNLWRTVYWSTQCLTWLLMPMMQSYIKAGDFTIKGKLKSAVVDNAIYYGSYLLICGILLIYLALKPGIDLDWSKLKAIASSASNTWGLFLLVLLLGYALVEVPRGLWRNSNHSYILNHAYFKAAKLSSDKCEAEEAVDDILESLRAISIVVPQGHPLRQNFETIMQKVPLELIERMNRRHLSGDMSTESPPTERSLIRLHKQVIKSLQLYQRTETQWNILVKEIFDLEDTLKNLNSRDKTFKHTFDRQRNIWNRYIFTPSLEWYWKCGLSSHIKRILAILAGILSAAVVWSELTFFNKYPVLSIFANIVNVAKVKYDYTTIEVLSTIVILYLCYCAYSTVLKIRVLNLYYLAPHHQTNEYSLIFSGMMFSRLTPPLCLNFLGLIHMDSHIIKKQILETHYTQIMGHMDVIAIISDGFNVYFPMAMLAFCFATYFNLGARILSAIGFQQFIGDDEITQDLVNDGRDLIKREKRKRQRMEESMNRRREFNERFPTFKHRNNTDTESRNLKTEAVVDLYDGTRYQSDNVDTQFPPDQLDIDERFGISTRNTINERYDSATELEPRFSEGYQLEGNYRNRVGYPPRGIFDDV